MGQKIGREEVRHVAQLARLSFDEKEEELLTKQLDSILRYMEKLNELETSGIRPTTHVSEIVNVFREDKVSESLGRNEALLNAPSSDGATFRVPKII